MNYVQTVVGKVPVDAIKYVDSHEHLIAYATQEIRDREIDLVLDSVAALNEDLSEFKNLNGNMIVEMTTMDYGRDVRKLQELAQLHNLHIIASTGFNKGLYNRKFLEQANIDEISEMLIKEVNEGIDGSDICAGVIKIGTSENRIEPWEEIGLRAISRAHKKTGVPITTHTQAGTMALEQLQIFAEERVPLENVILCHLDQNPDEQLHRKIVSKGVFLSYDSIAKPKYQTQDNAIRLICNLAKDNLHKQILIGGDYARRSCYKGYGGTLGFDKIFASFKNRLKLALESEGLPAEEIIEDIFCENPKRAFCFKQVTA